MNFAGFLFLFNLKLSFVLKAWKNEMFLIKSECGEMAYVLSFVGSPLSDLAAASGFCPKCKRQTSQIRNSNFGKCFWGLTSSMFDDVGMVVKNVIVVLKY